MNEESRPAKAASEDLAGGSICTHFHTQSLVAAVIGGRADPSELPLELWQLWADGFREGQAKMQPRLDRANRDADLWYMHANHTPDEIERMRLDAMDEGWRAYWDAGMPTEAVPA